MPPATPGAPRSAFRTWLHHQDPRGLSAAWSPRLWLGLVVVVPLFLAAAAHAPGGGDVVALRFLPAL
ncbi:MAG: hypothetical protein AB2A00_42490, partial [Myxococcota bacterium]